VEEGKAGLLFQPGDTQDLAAKVSSLVADRPRLQRMGAYGRSLVDERYGPQASHQTLMNIFQQVRVQ